MLGAGGITTTNLLLASSSPAPSIVVPINPTRVLDTRVGLGLQGPMVSRSSRNLQLTGTVATPGGTVVVVPNGATGVVLNVTAVRPSVRGFVSVRPAGASGRPTTSNLNVETGDTLPNAVTVALSPGGAIELTFDAYGVPGPTTDLLVDVVAYLAPAPAGGVPGPAGPAGPPGPQGPAGPPGEPLAGVQFSESTSFSTHTSSSLTQAYAITAVFPASGFATVSADFFVQVNQANTDGNCFLSSGSVASSGPQRSFRSGTETLVWDSAAITRTFAVTAGTRTFYLGCRRNSATGALSVVNPSMTVQYAPTRLTP